jgi:D-alanine-D-alanine ligase
MVKAPDNPCAESGAMMKRIRVGVVFGGQSGEHEVSLVSARAVMQGFDPQRYEVVPIGIRKDGQWLASGDVLATLEAQSERHLLPGGGLHVQEPVLPAQVTASPHVVLRGSPQGQTQIPAIDVVFPVLHGPMGEDGTIQGLFELAGIPYVGCGVLASAVGMDKAMMKAAFSAAGLPIVPWRLVRSAQLGHHSDAVVNELEQHLHYPMFVKPANMGSSVGISKAKNRADLLNGLRVAAQYDRRIVVEQGVSAREIEVSVLGNEQPQASVVGEIIPGNEWYDYEAKYLSDATQVVIPADAQLSAHVQQLALRAFHAVDGAGLARVDFLLDKEQNTVYLSEINTMPGFTPMSMYAKLWEASGLTYTALLDRLVALALERAKVAE